MVSSKPQRAGGTSSGGRALRIGLALRIFLAITALALAMGGGFSPTGTSSVATAAEAADPDVDTDTTPVDDASADTTLAAAAQSGRSASTGGRFPDASNTGVPAGTVLTPYAGPCTVTIDGSVIDAKLVACDELAIRASKVVIKNSRINGRVDLDTDLPGARNWSYLLQDSEVDGGIAQLPAVSYGNMEVVRSDVHGGETAVQCGEKALFCTVTDSWLHGQNIPADADWHLGGFLSNGGTNVLIRHNTIVCDAQPTASGGGCTGDINLFGDFAAVSHVTIQSNFLGASTGNAYCTFGGDEPTKQFPHADHVVYADNVFQRGSNGRCGAYGPVANFSSSGPGNEWRNNTWEDGPAVAPEM